MRLGYSKYSHYYMIYVWIRLCNSTNAEEGSQWWLEIISSGRWMVIYNCDYLYLKPNYKILLLAVFHLDGLVYCFITAICTDNFCASNRCLSKPHASLFFYLSFLLTCSIFFTGWENWWRTKKTMKTLINSILSQSLYHQLLSLGWVSPKFLTGWFNIFNLNLSLT